MKKTILCLMLIMGSFSAYGLDIRGDANSFTGNITSVTLTDEAVSYTHLTLPTILLV